MTYKFFFRRPLGGVAAFVGAVAFSLIPYACISPRPGDLAAGPIAVEPSAAAVAIERLTRETCGATWSLRDGSRSGTDLYVVSVFPEAGRAQQFNHFPSAGQIERFIIGNKALLADAANNVGTYCEHDHGDCHKGSGALNCYLDISRTTTALPRAAALARACNQRSLAFLGKTALKIIDSSEGQAFGDGRDLDGARLKICVQERDRP